ncbi:hypothetical protein C3Y87_17505 [Carbonactinospora thermoautotrophica]|uniref:hypothetical protein n=1 Tax=Carbonactinospora thermoautotrophica TaxID=1469144 RepID=UPI00226EF112|nr:hypothetical protein [Carbonactinospora thermoautotrophica]MCX9193167.1 hypothetical protein [Carbonactinospora thermoautotrophica]
MVAEWIEFIDVDEVTVQFYKSLWRNHIGPKWGSRPIGATRHVQVETWLKGLRHGTEETGPPGERRARPYSVRTVEGIRKMMALMLDDAVDEELIARNPLKGRKKTRGRRVDRRQPSTRQKIAATRWRCCRSRSTPASCGARGGFVHVITAAYTGMRFGELAALQRHNCRAFSRVPLIRVDDRKGNLKEVGGRLVLGPPKGGIGRDILLPPFLAAMLLELMRQTGTEHVFTTPQGKLLRRNTYHRDLWSKAAHGFTRSPSKRYKPLELAPVLPGFEFRGLRLTHNVWMTEDGIPEVVRANRLGHAMSDEMQQTYSVVSAAMEDRLLAGLQHRWETSVKEWAETQPLELVTQFCPISVANDARGPAADGGDRASDQAV